MDKKIIKTKAKKKNLKTSTIFKLVWRYLGEHRAMIYWCVFLLICASVISAVIPIVYGRLVDAVTKGNPDTKIVGLTIVAWLVFVLFSNWIGRFVNFKGNELGGEVYKGFMADIFSHYVQLPMSFHKEKKSGEELDRMGRAADHLWGITSDVVFYMVPGFLTAAVAITFMFLTEWRLSLLAIFILLIYSLATIKKTKPIVKVQKGVNKSWREAFGYFYDLVANIEVVKSHAKEVEENFNTKKSLVKIVNKNIDVNALWRKLSAWQDSIQGIGFVLVFAASLYLVSIGQITAGVLVTFVGYMNLVFRPFNQLADMYRTMQRGLAAISSAMKIFDMEKELYDTGIKLRDVSGKIEFKSVSFAYGKNKKSILKNINFRAKSGEMVALVGESGTGKTTLLSLISRYYDLNRGKILLDDIDIKNINLIFLREQIAIVPQEISLFNDTLKNNLLYAKKGAKDKEIITALEAANAWQFVNSFPDKLNQKVGERGIKLSTGQKQRIAIARAILRNPKILILDEATSALDSISERLVQEALKRLIAGRTTFVIAHRLSTIVHADKILVFDKGQLVEQGKHDELVAKDGVYAKLYKEQKF